MLQYLCYNIYVTISSYHNIYIYATIFSSSKKNRTCLYILGMLSKTHRDILDRLDWECASNIAVPRNPKLLFQQIPEHKFEGSFAISGEPINYPKDKNETRQEILNTVCSLSNFISAESASRTLKRLLTKDFC